MATASLLEALTRRAPGDAVDGGAGEGVCWARACAIDVAAALLSTTLFGATLLLPPLLLPLTLVDDDGLESEGDDVGAFDASRTSFCRARAAIQIAFDNQ